ncbi:MAG: two-component system alkaline phosphatase synthesis response regulator PhoP [Pirellulaceae bacterium]
MNKLEKTMNKSILLCDDEPHILRAAEYKFRRSGFDVRCAYDGEDGWNQIQERVPDIVVTDCQMPRLDGLGLAKRVLDDRELNLPVLMLSAKGFELSPDELEREYGVLALLAKPFSPRELQRLVEQILETGRATQIVAHPALDI